MPLFVSLGGPYQLLPGSPLSVTQLSMLFGMEQCFAFRKMILHTQLESLATFQLMICSTSEIVTRSE